MLLVETGKALTYADGTSYEIYHLLPFKICIRGTSVRGSRNTLRRIDKTHRVRSAVLSIPFVSDTLVNIIPTGLYVYIYIHSWVWV